MVRALALLSTVALAACTALAPPEPGPHPVSALLLGEQHDAPEHQQLQREVVEALADRKLLAALVLEMAEGGRSTRGLAAGASEQQVREALGWRTEAWPWELYGPAVMAAVNAGVPVLGANLSAAQMRAAMADAQLERLLPEAALRTQGEAIRVGHCNLLPEAHVPGMIRVQIARDQAMARTIAGAAVRGKTVVLLAGSGHVNPKLGVPVHLGSGFTTEAVMLPPVETGKDYCADMRKARSKPAS